MKLLYSRTRSEFTWSVNLNEHHRHFSSISLIFQINCVQFPNRTNRCLTRGRSYFLPVSYWSSWHCRRLPLLRTSDVQLSKSECRREKRNEEIRDYKERGDDVIDVSISISLFLSVWQGVSAFVSLLLSSLIHSFSQPFICSATNEQWRPSANPLTCTRAAFVRQEGKERERERTSVEQIAMCELPMRPNARHDKLRQLARTYLNAMPVPWSEKKSIHDAVWLSILRRVYLSLFNNLI